MALLQILLVSFFMTPAQASGYGDCVANGYSHSSCMGN